MNSNIFVPVNKGRPCPVCGGSSGCVVGEEGATAAVVCSRTESSKPVGNLGWLHLAHDDGPVWARSRQRILKAAWRLAEDER